MWGQHEVKSRRRLSWRNPYAFCEEAPMVGSDGAARASRSVRWMRVGVLGRGSVPFLRLVHVGKSDHSSKRSISPFRGPPTQRKQMWSPFFSCFATRSNGTSSKWHPGSLSREPNGEIWIGGEGWTALLPIRQVACSFPDTLP